MWRSGRFTFVTFQDNGGSTTANILLYKHVWTGKIATVILAAKAMKLIVFFYLFSNFMSSFVRLCMPSLFSQ